MRAGLVQFLVLAASLGALVGCENWPLYSYLPDPEAERPPLPTLEFDEVSANVVGSPQFLGALSGAQRLVVRGRMDSCGYEADASGSLWPEHPIDENGDGIADASRSRSGWYSGEVDAYSVTASASFRLSSELRWTEAPQDGLNSPYQPGDPGGAWASESDLDLLQYRLGSSTQTPPLSGDEGVSRRHPELLPAGLTLSVGQTAAVAVACHHALPSDYELTLVVTPL